MQKRHSITLLMLKKKFRAYKRILDQAIKSKDAQIGKKKEKITTLEAQLKTKPMKLELAEKQGKLDKLKESHQKLKNYHKSKKQNTLPSTQYKHLKAALKTKSDQISHLENENLDLKEKMEVLQQTSQSVNLKKDLKLYSSSTRMMVFDHIVNQVPTANIPVLIRQS